MKKLDELNRLVEEALNQLGIKFPRPKEKQILTSLARKCAEINSEDFPHFSNTPITNYNSRLRDGQVEETPELKQKCDLPPNERFFIDERGGCIAVRDKQHPKYDHTYPGLHETTHDVIFYGHGYRENGDGEWMISELTRMKANEVLAHLISMHTPSQPALQPLPEKMPVWFAGYFNGRGNDAINCYIHCKTIFGTQQSNLRPLPDEDELVNLFKVNTSLGVSTSREVAKYLRKHFGSQPLEWWMDLKKGDKFMYKKDVCTFDGRVAIGDVDYRTFNLEDCSPYTDPTQSFRSKLTPEMQVEFDKVIETINKK